MSPEHRYTPESFAACNAAFRRACERECPTREVFEQEHLCLPISAQALISSSQYDLVKCALPVPTQLDPTKSYNELFVGVDVARSQNLTVIVALEVGYWPKELRPDMDEDDRYVYRPVCVRTMHNVMIDEQFVALDRILSHKQVSKCVIDMGAIGRALSDMAVRKHGEGLVEAIGISRPVKEDLCEKFAGMVQRKRVSLPDDPRCREDILSMRRECSDKGILSYNGKTSFSHCDYFLGFALAVQATGASVSVNLHGDSAYREIQADAERKRLAGREEAA